MVTDNDIPSISVFSEKQAQADPALAPVPDTVLDQLRKLGQDAMTSPDAPLDLMRGSLILAAYDRPEAELEAYYHHWDTVTKRLSEIVAEATERAPEQGSQGYPVFQKNSEGSDGDMLTESDHDDHPLNQAQTELSQRVAWMKQTLYDEFEYHPDTKGYNNPDNMNMMRIMDRRSGLPVGLGIMWLALAHSQGWLAEGLKFPGHFLIRLQVKGQRMILDPFNPDKPMNAADLRAMVKKYLGEHEELDHSYLEPVPHIAVLTRFRNNAKIRYIAMADYGRALRVVEAMRLLVPKESRLWFEAGILKARIGTLQEALTDLEGFVTMTTDAALRYEAQMLIGQLRSEIS